MKKFKLNDLQLESFAVTLDDAKKDLIRGGYYTDSGVGCKENPKTDEIKEITCTTAGDKCGPQST